MMKVCRVEYLWGFTAHYLYIGKECGKIEKIGVFIHGVVASGCDFFSFYI